MAASLYGYSTSYDSTFVSVTIIANTYYRVVGDLIIHNSIEYTSGQVFYSGAITTCYSPFVASVSPVAALFGYSTSFDQIIYYFYEGNGVLGTAQETNDISLPLKADYTVELNAADNATLEILTGEAVGDVLTYTELRTLILANANITATIDDVKGLISLVDTLNP